MMSSQNHAVQRPGPFTSRSAIALLVGSLFFFYIAWWAHQKSSTKATELAVIEGVVASAGIERAASGLPGVTTPVLQFRLRERPRVFFVSRIGAAEAFEVLTDSLKFGRSVKLWVAPADGSSEGDKRLEARQVAVSGRIVFPLAAWSARFRLMRWISAVLCVLLFAASIAAHPRSPRS